MDFTIKITDKNIVGVAREIGYVIIDTKEGGEYNMVRKFGISNYPRFHAYTKQQGTNFIFSLHLDQKQPSYSGSHAHSGEYFGPLLDTEADRIKEILSNGN